MNYESKTHGVKRFRKTLNSSLANPNLHFEFKHDKLERNGLTFSKQTKCNTRFNQDQGFKRNQSIWLLNILNKQYHCKFEFKLEMYPYIINKIKLYLLWSCQFKKFEIYPHFEMHEMQCTYTVSTLLES